MAGLLGVVVDPTLKAYAWRKPKSTADADFLKLPSKCYAIAFGLTLGASHAYTLEVAKDHLARTTLMPGLPDVSASPILASTDSLNPEDSTVAKNKPAKQTRKTEPAPTTPQGTQPNAITIRGSAKWKEWLEGFAKHLRSKPTQVIDRSLAKLAELEKYKEPPDRMGT